MEFICYPADTISSAEYQCLSLNLDLPRTPPGDYPVNGSVGLGDPRSNMDAMNVTPQGDSPVEQDTSSPGCHQPAAAKQAITKRMRRTQACDRCRSRKVRCDASAQNPCSRCRRDSLDCVVRPHARGKRSIIRDSPQGESMTPASSETSQMTPEINCLPATPLSLKSPEPEPIDEIPRYLFSEPLKRALCDNYIAYVHPLFPIIDLATIREGPIGFFIQQGNERLSPLVFLAVLYSAIPHVDISALKAEGYDSCEELGLAIRSDFKRVEKKGVKHDWRSLVHAFLLMSSWYSPQTRLEAWKWSGDAIQLLDKHQDPDVRVGSCVDEVEYRCLWWSCFIRDQLMSLASQQSARMVFSASRVSMISEHDLRPLGSTENQTFASLFVERAKLSVILNQFSRSQRRSDGRHKTISGLHGCDKPSTTGEETVAQLLLWYCSLNNNTRYSQGTVYNRNTDSYLHDGLLPFYQALLLIPYYLTLIKANFLGESECCNSPQSKRVLYARQEVSRLLQDLIKNNRLRHIPTDLVECLMPFATTVLLEKTTTPSASREPMSNRIEGFKQCLKVMRAMMAHDRLQPQNDYRISLLGATCSLYAELEDRPRDSVLGVMAQSFMPCTDTNALDAAVSSTEKTFSDCSSPWHTPQHDEVLQGPLLHGVGINNHQDQPIELNEQTLPSDILIEDGFSEDLSEDLSAANYGALDFSWA